MDQQILLIIVLVTINLILLYCHYISYSKTLESFVNKDYYPGGINQLGGILFINLDNRPDRLKLIEKQLKCQLINFDKVSRIAGEYTPGNGHLGCSKSHLKAIRKAKEMNLDNVLILEDDFKFNLKPDQTHQLINNLLNNVQNEEWDVIFLVQTGGRKEDSKYPFLKKITNAQNGAGYLVNKHYYDNLIDVFEYSINNMKQTSTTSKNWEEFALDQLWKVNQKKDKWFVFDPEIGQQDTESSSTIQKITNYN